MALQHLYSRIPARISMFNRADSFDTFGRSEELERQFIEKELGLYEDIRLTAKESAKLRTEGLEPMYFQYQAKTGELIQSCVSFIPSDYTGERSSYLIHSLVLNGEEQIKALGTPDLKCFEPNLFEKDINKFNVAAPDARPFSELPSIEYIGGPAEDLSWLEDVNENTLKRFIYVCVSALCGKIKGVYFTLGDDEKNPSALALKYMNALDQLLPYHLRPYLSFVTSLNNQQRFSGVKLKCATSECGMVQAAKGVMISLRNGNFVGFKDEDVAANYLWVEFLWSLISNDHIRREFLLYCQEAVEKVPALANPSIKNLNDLIFMFKATCGAYDEFSVLPNDDKVSEFFDVYDKYRKALSDQYRINAMKCLKRYPASYSEIPKKVFAKLSKIYHTEPYCAKAVALDVVLDLIHTDVMRDKLFTFIKNNFVDEEDAIKEKINEDLCRVYYGGFLMPQILGFFTEHFADASDKSKLDIVSKLVLTVRTKAVQAELFNFFSLQYDNFTREAKDVFYDALLENLADGDEVSGLLMDILNKHIAGEPEEIKSKVRESLQVYVEKEGKKKSHPLTNLLVMKGGFGSDIVSEKVFAAGPESSAFKEYVASVCSGSLVQRTDNIISALKNQPDLSKEDAEGFLNQCKDAFMDNINANVYEIIDANEKMLEHLGHLENPDAVKCANQFTYEVFPILVAKNAKSFLAARNQLGGAEFLQTYGNTHEGCKSHPEFQVVDMYLKLKAATESYNGKELAESLNYFITNRELRLPSADYYSVDADKTLPLYSVVISSIKKGTADLQTVYSRLNPPTGDENQTADPAKAKEALSKVFNICKDFEFAETCGALSQIFTPEKCGIGGILSTIIATQGKNAKKIIEDEANALGDCACKAFALKQLSTIEPEKTSFFSNLFKKK